MGETHCSHSCAADRIHRTTYAMVSAGQDVASYTSPVEAGQVRKGGFIVIKGHACRVADVVKSKPGKHGPAKCTFVGTGLFNGKRYEHMWGSSQNVEVPNVKIQPYTLISLSHDTDAMSLMLDNGSTRQDLDLPIEMREEAAQLLETDGEAQIDVLNAIGMERVLQIKPCKYLENDSEGRQQWCSEAG